MSHDPFHCRHTLDADGTLYDYYSLPAASTALGVNLHRLPFSLKILCENLLRHQDGRTVTPADIQAIGTWLEKGTSSHEILFHPARVLMQDFTGVPAVVDLAAMRDAMQKLGGDPKRINPLTPVDLVIDHSVQVDHYAASTSFGQNVALEMQRNQERYEFLRWGQKAFANFRVVPPGTGICHQVNLEYLARVVWTAPTDGRTLAYPDTVVGTDSHTTMINGLAVLGWGVGGIEAEAAMLGQPISMVLPEVIGLELTGMLKEGTTATDVVLTVTQMLRRRGVVGKFVEFYGPGLQHLSLADRATIANMAPEYGATCGFFPIDRETIAYLRLSGRAAHQVALVETYANAQGLWRDEATEDPIFTDIIHLDLSSVVPSLAGPKRPQDRVPLTEAAASFRTALPEWIQEGRPAEVLRNLKVEGASYQLAHGDVVIAAITSCTNTSNPHVMLAAGLLARRALEKGLKVKPWVKTSLAPGSKVVTEYLARSGLQSALDGLGFYLVGYGCTTCIGNSGPLRPEISDAITKHDMVAASVLSGNRNFEGRIHPLVKANYLASPPLVVAYALAGSITIDLTTQPLGQDASGHPVYLRDIWPSNADIMRCVQDSVTPEMFATRYRDVFHGDDAWQALPIKEGLTYEWQLSSTYIHHPPYFVGMTSQPPKRHNIQGARILALLGDSITTDHISPAGNIARKSPAASYLVEHQVEPLDFNSYGARRGNHEVMVRGTFANIRIKNEMAPGTEGGVTRDVRTNEVLPIYEVAMRYQADSIPSVIIAGKEYGTGSSRDWAAKGVNLLGVKAVIAESFERIHRSNLIGMGVLPLMFTQGNSRKTLGLTGDEIVDIRGIEGTLTPGMKVPCTITRKDGSNISMELLCRLDTSDEVEYYAHGGILHRVIRSMIA